ncbi:hypothetical protein HanHA300_Chr16g0605741 [Helianthus annuus]|nr:hypothetical protein HanHA300_Chr16g0605741 [Helianthus annuus]
MPTTSQPHLTRDTEIKKKKKKKTFCHFSPNLKLITFRALWFAFC